MTVTTLNLQPLTRGGFAPFGEVIETTGATQAAMNDGRFSRFSDLASVDIDADGKVCVSIAVCQSASRLPVAVECVERHPHGSQAFIPLNNGPIMVVVAQAGSAPAAASLRAFISNGEQGINYFRGVWHMPMVALQPAQRFLIIDRKGAGDNCEVHYYADETVMICE